jgi:sporulation protein YlmC with PRC-barrel domain
METVMRKFLGAASALLLLSGAAASGTAWAADPEAPAATGAPTQLVPAKPALRSQARTDETAAQRTSAEQLIGKRVVGANNEDIGKVKDVILEPKTGKARQLVVASGGFLGIGEKLIAVDYNDASLPAGASKVSIPDLSRAQVQAMRDFTYDDNMVALSRSTDMDKASIDSSTHNTAK